MNLRYLRLFYNGAFSIASKNNLEDQNLLLATVPSLAKKTSYSQNFSIVNQNLQCQTLLSVSKSIRKNGFN
jgi:hypothetical protein